MKYPVLEDALNDMAVIQTTFDTVDLFASDDPIRTDLFEIVLDAQNNLIARFQDLCEGMQANLPAYDLDAEKVKQCVLAMRTHGYPGRSLNRMIKIKAFDEGDVLYYNWVPGLEDLEVVRQTPARQIIMLLFNDMLQRCQERANYADGPMFRQKVFQKYVALLFLCYASTDQMFFGNCG